jgi:predicted ATPase/DNA-binding CsgD family transcriptional regulator
MHTARSPLETHPERLRSGRALHSIPAPTARLIGRTTELAALHTLLQNPIHRLITITGIGGIGKTHLARHYAFELVHERDPQQYPDGVFFVECTEVLVGAASDDMVAAQIASAIGLMLSGPDPALIQLEAYLRDRQILLLLDGEQLAILAPLISQLLQHVPKLTILAISRERIGIAGEFAWPLTSLACPPERTPHALQEYPAAVLFLERAHHSSVHLEITAETALAIGRICRLLDGLPLALELAAGWLNILTCSEIANDLEQSLDLLQSDRPDLPLRHRSLRAVFATAWERLSTPQLMLLRRLSIFKGSFRRDDLEAVANRLAGWPVLPKAELLATIAALVDLSLIRKEQTTAITRFYLPRIVRQYAAELLADTAELPPVTIAHMRHVLEFVAGLTDTLRGTSQHDALAMIEERLPDIRFAWSIAVQYREAELLGSAAPALFHYYDMRSWFREGYELFAAAQRALSDAPAVYALLIARQGWFAFHLGKTSEAAELLATSIQLQRATAPTNQHVFAINYYAAVLLYAGDIAQAQHYAMQGRDQARALADSYGQAIANNILGQIAYEQADYRSAQALSAQSLALEQQLGNRWSMAYSLYNLGKAAYAARQYDAAEHMFQQSLLIRTELHDLRGMAISLCRLGDTAQALGAQLQALDYYQQAFQVFADIGNQWGMASALLLLGQFAIKQSLFGPASRILQEALMHARAAQTRPQIIAIMAAFAMLTPHAHDWQHTLGQLAQQPDLDLTDPYVVQQLAYATSPSTIRGSMAEALAQLRQRIAEPAVSQSVPTHTPTTIESLTMREREVLQLVAEGLSDAQIAERLILSRRTISTHLSTIYSKLHVNSRTAAIRAAREQGLIVA